MFLKPLGLAVLGFELLWVGLPADEGVRFGLWQTGVV
jgi:hypothetical protein